MLLKDDYSTIDTIYINMKKYFFTFFFVAIISCSPKLFNKKWTEEISPLRYKVQFETSKGVFEIEVDRKLSPKAADRFYQLVKHRYFDNQLFYRVNPGFVAQFGSSDSTSINNWGSVKVPDEKVVKGNTKGTISFARSGPETRATDLFINLSDNERLDTIFYNDVKGFPTFGKVTKGMDVVSALYSGYGDKTMGTLDLMYSNKSDFIKMFPKLDTIHKATLLK